MKAVPTDRHNPCSVQHRSPRNRRQEKSKKHAHDPERAVDRRAWSRVIALDGGTSNTRARLIQDGRIVGSARRTVGVRDSVLRNCFKNGSRPRKPRKNKHFARFLKQSLSDRSSGQRLADAVREVIAEAAGFRRWAGARNDYTAGP